MGDCNDPSRVEHHEFMEICTHTPSGQVDLRSVISVVARCGRALGRFLVSRHATCSLVKMDFLKSAGLEDLEIVEDKCILLKDLVTEKQARALGRARVPLEVGDTVMEHGLVVVERSVCELDGIIGLDLLEIHRWAISQHAS